MKYSQAQPLTKRVAVVQSNYIPWQGYFQMISSVDEFILFDDVQYTRRDWRNRNLIKTPQGLNWLTIPVQVKGKYFQPIREVEIEGSSWIDKHWRTIELNYARAPFFSEVAEFLSPIFEASKNDNNLSSVNRRFIQAICDYTGIKTKISDSSDFEIIEGKNERLISLCKQVNATEYVSGPSANGYLDEVLFERAGLKVTWSDYSGLFTYPQLWGEFQQAVSIIDLLFNCGRSESLRLFTSNQTCGSCGIRERK